MPARRRGLQGSTAPRAVRRPQPREVAIARVVAPSPALNAALSLALRLGSILALCVPLAADDMLPRLDTDDPRHVRAVYFDLLGRPPFEHERLLAERVGAERLVRGLAGSLAFWENWYEEELYFFLLLENFRPREGRPHTRLAARLASGDLHVISAVQHLVNSSAFDRANPGNDTFVSVVFEQLLGLEVQRHRAELEAGKRMYDGDTVRLWGQVGTTQADVVRITLTRDEFAEHYLARHHARLLGRPPEGRALRADAQRLRENPHLFPDIVAEWILSDDYARGLRTLRPKSDHQFVRGLYVDLTGALPDPQVVQRNRAALGAVADRGPLRAVIARVVVAAEGTRLSDHAGLRPDELVTLSFLHHLGRLPDAEELELVSTAYAQNDATPENLALALVTHREYQHY